MWNIHDWLKVTNADDCCVSAHFRREMQTFHKLF